MFSSVNMNVNEHRLFGSVAVATDAEWRLFFCVCCHVFPGLSEQLRIVNKHDFINMTSLKTTWMYLWPDAKHYGDRCEKLETQRFYQNRYSFTETNMNVCAFIHSLVKSFSNRTNAYGS